MSDAIEDPEPSRPHRQEKPPRRHVLLRLFGIGPGGIIRLILWCVGVGLVIQLMNQARNPEPQTVVPFLEAALGAIGSAFQWAITNGWKPAITGALVVLPLWVLWRLLTLPFRRR